VKLIWAIWVMCLLAVGVFGLTAKADAAVMAPVGTVVNAKVSATTPGPATLLLLGSGLLGLGGAVRRRIGHG
jgi:hypothetical protein